MKLNALQFAARCEDLRLTPRIKCALFDIMVNGETWSSTVTRRGVSRSGILRAMRRISGPLLCPHCGRPIHGRDVK